MCFVGLSAKSGACDLGMGIAQSGRMHGRLVLSISAVIALAAIGCADPKKTQRVASNAGDGSSNSFQSSSENSSREVSLTYELVMNGCNTSRQQFSSIDGLCDGLQDEMLNHGCALDLRRLEFSIRCGGRSWRPRTGGAGAKAPAGRVELGSAATAIPYDKHPLMPQAETEARASTVAASLSAGGVRAFPEGLGLLEVHGQADSQGLRPKSFCSGALVAEDLVLTARSCLPEALRRRNGDCVGQIYMHFPRLALGKVSSETAICVNVEAVSALAVSASGASAEIGPDLALLRIAHKTSRAPLKISRQGIANGEAIRVFMFSALAVGSGQSQAARRLDCRAAQDSYVLPSFDEEKRAVFTLGSCAVPADIRGAVALDAQGALSGLIGGRFTPEMLGMLYVALRGNAQIQGSNGRMHTLAWGSNLACFDAGDVAPHILSSPVSPSCAISPGAAKQTLEAPKEVRDAIAREFEQWKRGPSAGGRDFTLKGMPSSEHPVAWSPELKCSDGRAAVDDVIHKEQLPEWRYRFNANLQITGYIRASTRVNRKSCL